MTPSQEQLADMPLNATKTMDACTGRFGAPNDESSCSQHWVSHLKVHDQFRLWWLVEGAAMEMSSTYLVYTANQETLAK